MGFFFPGISFCFFPCGFNFVCPGGKGLGFDFYFILVIISDLGVSKLAERDMLNHI